MTTRVIHLRPGDRVEAGDRAATFIMQRPHPLFPRLQLVAWRADDGSYSFDAMAPGQEVIGQVLDASEPQRQYRLRQALGVGAPTA